MSLHNPYRIPSCKTQALDYQLAKSMGKQQNSNYYCPYSLLPIKDTPLDINFKMSQIEEFGREYSQFFKIIKVLLIAFVVILLDTGFPTLQDTFLMGEDVKILPFGANQIRLSPLQDGFPQQKFVMLSLMSFVTLFIILLIFRILQYLRAPKVHLGQQNYSVILKNVPICKGESTAQKIKSFLKENLNNCSIKQIIVIAKIEQYEKLTQEIQQKISDWKSVLQKKGRTNEDVLACLKNIESSVQNLEDWKKRRDLCEGENSSGNAIVVFENKESVEEILATQFFNKNKIQASFGELAQDENQMMEVCRAPSPQDIKWDNLGFSEAEKKSKKRLGSLCLIVLFGIFFLTYFLTQIIFGRTVGTQEKQKSINKTASVFGLITMSILNHLFLPCLINMLEKFEKLDSGTESQIGFMKKYATFCFLFKVVAILAVQTIFFSSSNAALVAVSKITTFLIIDTFLYPILWLINFPHLLKFLKRKCFMNRQHMTQKQTNNLFENPRFNVGLKYSLLLTMFWNITIFINLIPLTSVSIPIFAFIFYWTSKLNLSKRQSIDQNQINVVAFFPQFLCCLECALMLKPAVNLLFWGIKNEGPAIQQIFMFLFAVGYYIYSKDKIVKKIVNILKLQRVQCEKQKDEISEEIRVYDRQKFTSLYRIEYPFTATFEDRVKFLQSVRKDKSIQFRQPELAQNNENPSENKNEAAGIQEKREDAEVSKPAVEQAVKEQIDDEEQIVDTDRQMATSP